MSKIFYHGAPAFSLWEVGPSHFITKQDRHRDMPRPERGHRAHGAAGPCTRTHARMGGERMMARAVHLLDVRGCAF